jgi:hypothetical protein
MAHFLITYDRELEQSEIVSYNDPMEAFDEFSRKERELMGDERYEVVLLAAEHEEDLRLTHPNFFEVGDMLPA